MKEKIIYSYLNMLVQDNMVFNGLVWVPKFFKFEKVIQGVIDQQGLQGLYYQKCNEDIPGLEKPSMFKSNEFVFVF